MTQAPQRLRNCSTGGSGGPGEAVPLGDPLLHPRSRAALTPGSLRLIRIQDRAPARGIERREPEGEGGRSGRTSTVECGPERAWAQGSLSARLSQREAATPGQGQRSLPGAPEQQKWENRQRPQAPGAPPERGCRAATPAGQAHTAHRLDSAHGERRRHPSAPDRQTRVLGSACHQHVLRRLLGSSEKRRTWAAIPRNHTNFPP